jgi:MFS family permease
VSPGIALLLWGLSEVGTQNGTRAGFGHPAVIVPLLAGAGLIAAFTLRALRTGDPLVDLRLFRVSSFTVSTVLQFLFGFVLYGAMLILPLYFQQVRGRDALEAGMLLAPQGIGVLAIRGFAGGLSDRYGARWIVFAGLLVTAVGSLPFALLGATADQWLLIASLVVRGVGLGAVTIPVTASAFQGLDRAQIPHASIITRAAQQVGGAFGSAVLAVILADRLTSGQLGAYHTTFWCSIAFTLVAVAVALGLPARPAGSRTPPVADRVEAGHPER